MAKNPVAVGIDIGGTNTVFGVVERSGKILFEEKIKTTSYDEVEHLVSHIIGRVNEVTGKSGEDVELLGFGIGAPMGNINKGTIEHAAGLPWKGIVPLADIFEKFTSLPVVVTNDANAAAVGEMVYGGAKGMKDFIVITLGTGLGSGIVIDGKLVYGHSGFAGELGHTQVVGGFPKRECGCGKTGCLETYVSATGLKRTYISLMADNLLPGELRNSRFDELDAKMIHEAAMNGDSLALKAFSLTGKILGTSLANVVAVTDPGAIFLFGGLALAGELIRKPAIESMEENLLSIYKGRVKLLVSELSTQNAAVLGASSLVWSNLKS